MQEMVPNILDYIKNANGHLLNLTCVFSPGKQLADEITSFSGI